MQKQITAWRISPAEYRSTAFSGEGAKEYGGRFNSVGTPIIYTAGSLALAMLELLVRVNSRRRLQNRVCLPVQFRDTHVAEQAAELPDDWDARPYTAASQQMGDAWIQSERSLVLRVPSVVVPQEPNYLINPRHPHFDELEFGDPTPLQLDPRLYAE